jgi:hypothetical protein
MHDIRTIVHDQGRINHDADDAVASGTNPQRAPLPPAAEKIETAFILLLTCYFVNVVCTVYYD